MYHVFFSFQKLPFSMKSNGSPPALHRAESRNGVTSSDTRHHHMTSSHNDTSAKSERLSPTAVFPYNYPQHKAIEKTKSPLAAVCSTPHPALLLTSSTPAGVLTPHISPTAYTPQLNGLSTVRPFVITPDMMGAGGFSKDIILRHLQQYRPPVQLVPTPIPPSAPPKSPNPPKVTVTNGVKRKIVEESSFRPLDLSSSGNKRKRSNEDVSPQPTPPPPPTVVENGHPISSSTNEKLEEKVKALRRYCSPLKVIIHFVTLMDNTPFLHVILVIV